MPTYEFVCAACIGQPRREKRRMMAIAFDSAIGKGHPDG